MFSVHHNLDPYPIPKDKTPLFINEPWLLDMSITRDYINEDDSLPENEDDNIRVFVPLDLNREAILRRLRFIINHFEEANEMNEMTFEYAVSRLLSQVEIYDQIWYARHMPERGEHSEEAKLLMIDFIKELESIPDGGAETFPFELIDELRSTWCLAP
jgi:hypothetical protein